jgi:hypothetical protein
MLKFYSNLTNSAILIYQSKPSVLLEFKWSIGWINSNRYIQANLVYYISDFCWWFKLSIELLEGKLILNISECVWWNKFDSINH